MTILELSDETLGKLLAPRWTVATVMNVMSLRTEDASRKPDQFAISFFASIARSVGKDSEATIESYDAASPLDRNDFGKLTPEALDSLALQYLKTAGGKKENLGTQSNEKGTEQLLRVATAQAEKADASVKSLGKVFGVGHSDKFSDLAKFGLGKVVEDMQNPIRSWHGKVALSKELSEAFAHSDLLGRKVDGALSGFSVPRSFSESTMPDLREHSFQLPLNPAFETNERLAELSTNIEQLVEVAHLQAELTQAIREASDLALKNSVQSSLEAAAATRLAKRSVLLTCGAIAIAIATSVWTICDNHVLSASTDIRLKEEIRLLDEISGKLTAGTPQPSSVSSGKK